MSQQNLPEWWTKDLVKFWLEEAAETEKSFPCVKPSGHVSFWPDIRRDYSEAYGWNDEDEIRCVPSSAQVDRYDYVSQWCRLLRVDHARVVWANALHIPQKLIMDKHNINSRSTLHKYLTKSYLKIAAELNRGVDFRKLGREIVSVKHASVNLKVNKMKGR